MPETLEELEARHEQELEEHEEKKKAHLEAARALGKGKKAKAAADAAERDIGTWDYEIKVRHAEELEELETEGKDADAGSGDDAATASVPDDAAAKAKAAQDAEAEAARIQAKKDKAAKKKGSKVGKAASTQVDPPKLADLQIPQSPKSPSLAGCRSPTMSGMRSPSQRWKDDPVSVEDVAPAMEAAKRDDFEIIEGIQPYSDAVRDDPRLKAILEEVTALSKDAFEEDALGMVTRKKGWKLTLLVRTENASSSQGAKKPIPDIPSFSLDGTADADLEEFDDGGPPLIGFIVYRLKPELQAFSIAKIAVVPEHRGKGHGGRLMHWVKQMAKKQKDIICISLSSLPEAVPFYKKLRFQPVEVNIPDSEDNVEGQVYMEYQIRKGGKKR